MAFKVGDRVKMAGLSCNSARTGQIYTVQADSCGSNTSQRGLLGIGGTKENLCHCFDIVGMWELISANNKSMSLKEKMALVFKGEPQKSFIKAGIMDSSEILTEDGTALLLSYIIKNDVASIATKFNTDVVQPILADQEKDK